MKGLLLGSLFLSFIFIACSENVNVENDSSATSSVDGSTSNNNLDSTNSNTLDGVAGSSNVSNTKSVYFAFDKFIVDNSSIKVVNINAKYIIDNNYSVKLEGNADERGTDEYNYALALKRASAVKDMLVSYGVDPNKIELVSYGESKPKCIEQTQKCYRENRRVDFIITPAR